MFLVRANEYLKTFLIKIIFLYWLLKIKII